MPCSTSADGTIAIDEWRAVVEADAASTEDPA